VIFIVFFCVFEPRPEEHQKEHQQNPEKEEEEEGHQPHTNGWLLVVVGFKLGWLDIDT
jgi:hypothetical protein